MSRRAVSIVDLPCPVLGRVLELLPPSLHLLQVHSSFFRAATEECPTWWRHTVIKRRGDKRALTGFSRVASQFKALQLDDKHAGALLLPYLEAASTRCRLLEELCLEVATVAQFQGAFQAIANLLSLRCLALHVSTQPSLSSSSSSGWLPGSVVSPLSRLTRLESADLNLWFARGEVPQEVLRSLAALTHLGFHSNPAALPLLTVGWGGGEAAQGSGGEVGEGTGGEAAGASSGDDEAGISGGGAAAAGGPMLRTLSFSGARLAPVNCSLASLAQLERLVLGPSALCAELRALLPALPALTSLAIERPVSKLRLDMDPDSQAAGLAAAYNCDQLRELELKGWGLLRLEPLPHEAFPRLTRLALGDSWPFQGHPRPHNAAGLWQVPESLPGACPLLAELDLSACTCVKLRDAGTLAVLRLLPSLSRVVLPHGTLERTAAHVRQYLGQAVEVVGGGGEAAAA